MIGKNVEKKQIELKDINHVEGIKALIDLDYLIKQLKFYIEIYHIKIKQSEIEPYLCNCILDSTLLSIRKLYEFFFYFDFKNKNDKIKDDAFAEYFFQYIDDWKNLKITNNIDYDAINLRLNKKFELDKRGIHFTFNKKNNRIQIEFIIPELIMVYDLFKRNNCFDKNKKVNSNRSEIELIKLVNNNYHIGNKSDNVTTNNDIKIANLIDIIYDTTKIVEYGLTEDKIEIVEGE